MSSEIKTNELMRLDFGSWPANHAHETMLTSTCAGKCNGGVDWEDYL